MADASTLADELARRGFVPFAGLGRFAEHVSGAYARKPSRGIGELHELVLVVDRTGLDPGAAHDGSPHRTSARRSPFAAPVHEVVALAKALPTSFSSPLARVTIVEIAHGPLTSDDRRRVDQYTAPDGPTLLDAVRVDLEASTAYATDSASPRRTGLVRSGDPIAWVAESLGAKLERHDPEGKQSPRLFAPRGVAVATFLLSPIAGAALLGWNFHRTRRTSLALALLVMFAVILALITALLPRIAMVPVTLASVYSFGQTTRGMFGTPLRKASSLFAAALGVAALVLYVAITAVVVAIATFVH